MDRRYQPSDIEIREDGESTVVSGYAAVFYRADDPGTEFDPLPDVKERIMPGAFDRALEEGDDVRALFNHAPSQLLGRTKSGTLTLSKNRRGLKYDITLPNTTIGRDVQESIKRGDLTGSSFAFKVDSEKWTSRSDGQGELREIHDVQLFDVGPVTYPAYKSTTTDVSREMDVAECRQSLDG